jgi:hypothetical protein
MNVNASVKDVTEAIPVVSAPGRCVRLSYRRGGLNTTTVDRGWLDTEIQALINRPATSAAVGGAIFCRDSSTPRYMIKVFKHVRTPSVSAAVAECLSYFTAIRHA